MSFGLLNYIGFDSYDRRHQRSYKYISACNTMSQWDLITCCMSVLVRARWKMHRTWSAPHTQPGTVNRHHWRWEKRQPRRSEGLLQVMFSLFINTISFISCWTLFYLILAFPHLYKTTQRGQKQHRMCNCACRADILTRSPVWLVKH